MSDSYLTIEKPSEGVYKEKGSKFLGFAYPIQNDEEIKIHISALKADHQNSRHFCYAFVLKPDYSHYRGSDDGEPSGTAGAPILGQINSKALTNTLVVVARYFGGTKLGVGGLINAYRTAAQKALNNAEIIKKTVDDYYTQRFTYEQTGDVMRVLGDALVKINNQTFEADCLIEFSIRKSEAKRVIDQLKKLSTLELKFVKTE
jgi:uncharacterized YigZ family protein